MLVRENTLSLKCHLHCFQQSRCGAPARCAEQLTLFCSCLSASSRGADIHTTLYGNTLQCRSSLPTHMLLPAGSLHLQTCRVSNHVIRVLLQHPAALHHDIPCTFASSFILPRFLYLCFHGVTISSLPSPLALPQRAAGPQRT